MALYFHSGAEITSVRTYPSLQSLIFPRTLSIKIKWSGLFLFSAWGTIIFHSPPSRQWCYVFGWFSLLIYPGKHRLQTIIHLAWPGHHPHSHCLSSQQESNSISLPTILFFISFLSLVSRKTGKSLSSLTESFSALPVPQPSTSFLSTSL